MQGRRDQDNESNNSGKEQESSSSNGTGRQRIEPGMTGRFRALLGETGHQRAVPGETGNQRIEPGQTARFREMLTETGRMPALPSKTGEYAIPQRPPNMPRVEAPPPQQKVARPKREQVTPEVRKRRLIMLISAIVVCAVLAFFATRIVISVSSGLSASSGAASTAVDFLSGLDSQNYNQAYKDLGPTITLRLTPDIFRQQAQSYDHCFGPVQNYSEVANSATTNQDGSQSYTYSVTRSKSPKPFQMRLTLQQDQSGKWGISDYGNSLGASQPTCK